MGERIGRLKTRAEFLRVAAARSKSVTPGLVLQSAPRPAEDGALLPPRVGYTASRKVGGAVSRNRARRRLRAAVAQVIATHAEAGRDYVLIARSTTPARPFALLVEDLESGLKRLGAWRGDA